MTPSYITAIVTDDEGRLSERDGIVCPTSDEAAVTITVNLEDLRQPILGFGAAFTDAACYNISQCEPGVRKALLSELLSDEGMGFSVARICVGQSDYGRVRYSYDDTVDDFELQDFSLDYDRSYIIPTILDARAIRPDLFLLSSPWSPPGWMKTSGTMLGGWMRGQYLSVYAKYYLKYIQGYADAGIKINALTTQNEVETHQEGTMPACLWHPELEVAFVRDHLGPLLNAQGFDIDIWLVDHNYNLWQRAVWMLEQEGLSEYSTAVAFHGYIGTADQMKNVTDAVPGTRLYWTEGGPMYNAVDYKTDWCNWATSVTDTMTYGCRCYMAWNFALDEAGKPNIGPFSCGGLVTIDSETKAITRSGQFYALGHFSKYVKRGATCLGTSETDSQSKGTTDSENIRHVAFRNPDGSIVLVLTNPGPERIVGLKAGRTEASISLPADSVVTLIWTD